MRRLLLRASPTHWVVAAFVLAVSLSNCRCVDQRQADPWDFGGSDAFETDARVDTAPPPPDIGPFDVYTPPDIEDAEIDTERWQPEEVLPDVDCEEDALTDRTSLVVDQNGTTWIGYHRYRGRTCANPTLVVAHKRPGGSWVEEDIQPHSGIFGISSIEPNRPIAVYPDTEAGVFKAAHRTGARSWEERVFDVGDRLVQDNDGFDVTEDGTSFWVTYAGLGAPSVQLFEFDTTASNPEWQSRTSLEAENPEAAIARGLRADRRNSVYLVHHDDERERFGLARYDKRRDSWVERSYLEGENAGARVHSFVITENRDLCMSSRIYERLLVTCGSMSDLSSDRKLFQNEPIPSSFPASIIEGRNGTLYVAFHPPGDPKEPVDSELRVAKRPPGGEWSVETVFPNSAFGVSTAIDTSGKLVLGFYTCDEDGQCSLKVLREDPSKL